MCVAPLLTRSHQQSCNTRRGTGTSAWFFGNRTWAYHGLLFGNPLWFDAALVNKLVHYCAWLLSGGLEILRLRLR